MVIMVEVGGSQVKDKLRKLPLLDGPIAIGISGLNKQLHLLWSDEDALRLEG